MQQMKTTRNRSRPKPGTSPKRQKGFEQVFEKIYRMVLRIPPGKVMTYGQIARLLDDRFSPRLVGWAMHATPHDERQIPWHRVINSRGSISTGRVITHEPDLQRLLLEGEGVVFNDGGRCDLAVFQWTPGLKKLSASTRNQTKVTGQKRARAVTKRRQAGSLPDISKAKKPRRKTRNGNNS